MVEENREISSLTGLRFLFALWVFLFHVNGRWPFLSQGPFSEFIGLGAIGMTMFFFLSGFILAHNYSKDIRKSRFFVARFARIYPVYLVTAIMTITELFNPKRIDLSGMQVLLAVLSGLFLLQAWFPALFTFWNYSGSWSISAEAFFYALFPKLNKMIRTLKKRSTYFFCIANYLVMLFIGLAIVMLSNSVIEPGKGLGSVYSIPIFRLPEFILGMGVYRILEVSPNLRFSIGLGYLTFLFFALFVLDVVIVGNELPIYLTHDYIVLPFISFLTLFLTLRKSWFSAFLSSSILNLLGRSSYSFYSLQVVLILSIVHLRPPTNTSNFLPQENLNILIILFVCNVILAILFFYFIEEPIRKKIKVLAFRSS